MTKIINCYFEIEDDQLPIIYSDNYNVNFMGLENLHPFDAKKWGNIFRLLKISGFLNDNNIVRPNEYSWNIATITEICPLIFIPNYFIQKAYLKPMRYQVGGSILSGKLALERGWSINIGGGFHHCCANKGGGFCPFADITLLIQHLFIYYPEIIKKVMIVDLDAHQGNGYARDFQDNENIFIIDIYNKHIYPKDEKAKKFIKKKIEIDNFIEDSEYLNLVRTNLKSAIKEFQPNFIVYNAGTDILKGDPLGALSVSPLGIIKRDEIIFREAHYYNIPVTMLLSGGYLRRTAQIIAGSILNLNDIGLLKNKNK